MTSPINKVADWISRRPVATQQMMATAIMCLMASTFITITIIGGGVEIMSVLFG